VTRVLLAGESWVTTSIHTKGFDSFTTVSYHEGAGALLAALRAGGHDVGFMPNHVAATDFPSTEEALAAFDVVILSDIGSNTLLLHPDTFTRGRPTPNRLKLLREWVTNGGGLMMAGGYLSFQGFEGKANYHRTPIEEILPVDIDPYDDRVETPEGVRAHVVRSGHPVVAGLDQDWPILLGYQHTTLKPDAELLATVEGDVMLAARQVGRGRTLAFTSDISPHWAPEEFMSWDGYGRLFAQAMTWLAGREL
jgi:uncharacterized membrane protein